MEVTGKIHLTGKQEAVLETGGVVTIPASCSIVRHFCRPASRELMAQ